MVFDRGRPPGFSDVGRPVVGRQHLKGGHQIADTHCVLPPGGTLWEAAKSQIPVLIRIHRTPKPKTFCVQFLIEDRKSLKCTGGGREVDGRCTGGGREVHGRWTEVARLGTSFGNSFRNWRRQVLNSQPITPDLGDSFRDSTISGGSMRGEVVRGITLKE